MSGYDDGEEPSQSQSSAKESLSSEPRGAEHAEENTRESARTEPESNWGVLAGFVLAFVLQILQVMILIFNPPLIPFAGVTQLAYIVPAILIARYEGRQRLATGIAIGAAAIFLLNATGVILLRYLVPFLLHSRTYEVHF
ncbi:MAG: hypothetical protein ACREDR_31255, partial [Blastocatellia bacterium]